MEERLYIEIKRVFGEPTVIKGYSSSQVASILRKKWCKYRDPVAVGLDASRFDQHVSEDILKWSHEHYLKHYVAEDRTYFSSLLKKTVRNVCHARVKNAGFDYVVAGTRMSGDMDTGCGNCLIMCAMIYSYMAHHNLKASLANNGDDCVLILERVDLHKLNSVKPWFNSLGFTMEVEPPVDVFERIVFCQAQPINTPEGWIMMRSPLRAISRDTMFLKSIATDFEFRCWIKAVAEGGLALSGGIPIFDAFYRCLLRNSKGRYRHKGKLEEAVVLEHLVPHDWGVKQLIKNMNRMECDITDLARLSFYRGTGIIPQQQINIEKQYDLITELEFGLEYSPVEPLLLAP